MADIVQTTISGDFIDLQRREAIVELVSALEVIEYYISGDGTVGPYTLKDASGNTKPGRPGTTKVWVNDRRFYRYTTQSVTEDSWKFQENTNSYGNVESITFRYALSNVNKILIEFLPAINPDL